MKSDRIIIKNKRFVRVLEDGRTEPIVLTPRVLAHLRQGAAGGRPVE